MRSVDPFSVFFFLIIAGVVGLLVGSFIHENEKVETCRKVCEPKEHAFEYRNKASDRCYCIEADGTFKLKKIW